MTSSAKGSKSATNPYDDDLPDIGIMSILVPLIIGGALVVAALILWQQHERGVIETEAAKVEEDVRADLLSAYRLLQAERHHDTLVAIAAIEEKVKFLCRNEQDPGAYSDYKISFLLIEGLAKFAQDPIANASYAEDNFNQAMSFIRSASGEAWELVLLGRARARLEQDKDAEAIMDLDVLIAGNPNYGSAYYWRSLAKSKVGDQEGARTDRRRAENLCSWPPLREPIRISETAKERLFDAE